MIQIESNRANHLADEKIKNLIEFIRPRMKELSPRNKVILDILRHLKKSVYKFKQTANVMAKELDLLKSDDRYKWNLVGPELIRFDPWFMAKVKKVEYRYDLTLST